MVNHICFLQYNLEGGGAERKVCTLANYFASKGINVEIGLFGVNKVAYDLDDKVKVTYLRRENFEYKSVFEKFRYTLRRFLQSVFAFFGGAIAILGRILKIKKLQLINQERILKHYEKIDSYYATTQRFIHNRSDAVFITMMVSSYLAVLDIMKNQWAEGIKVPYLVMDCTDPKHNADAVMDKNRTECYPKADRVLVMTQGAKDYFSEEIQKKCVIIPNPVRNDLPEPYIGKRKHIIVNYCRLNSQKNLVLLINAFALFHKDFPDYKLEIYGKGELEGELNNLIEELDITDCAHIYDFDPKIHEKIKDYMMYVSSSDYEGFPNSVLEALSLGMPVISTDCDFGPRDMICDHENGLLVPVNDVEAMRQAMAEIAKDENFAEELGRKAAETRKKYDVEIIGRMWLNLIEEVATERGLI